MTTDTANGIAFVVLFLGVVFFLVGLMILGWGSDHSLSTTITVGWILMVISAVAIIVSILILIFYKSPKDPVQQTVTQPLLTQQPPMYVLVQ